MSTAAHRQAGSCSYCGASLTGTYFINGWDQRYCERHVDEWEKCEFCHRFIREVEPRHRLPGGYVRCDQCGDVEIEDPDLAKDLVGRQIRWLQRQGLTTTGKVRFRVWLVDRKDLKNAETGIDALGITSVWPTSITDPTPARMLVRLLRGMPSPMFEGVTAHELGHAWLAIREITGLSKQEEEGFCELLAYRYYQQHPEPLAAYRAQLLAKNPDSTYGDGYRKLAFLQGAIGFRTMVRHLIDHGTLPDLPKGHA